MTSQNFAALSSEEISELMKILQKRFEKNIHRHNHVSWTDVQQKLYNNPGTLWSLHEMETTGGEPDVVVFHEKQTELIFVDCALETPKGRRSICYDNEALQSRKEHKPANSAVGMADQMGIEMLTEEEYRQLQVIEPLDLKTSSWVKTPRNIRNLGGALFCDRRYDTVFLYHNGAESYYGSRGFRGKLHV